MSPVKINSPNSLNPKRGEGPLDQSSHRSHYKSYRQNNEKENHGITSKKPLHTNAKSPRPPFTKKHISSGSSKSIRKGSVSRSVGVPDKSQNIASPAATRKKPVTTPEARISEIEWMKLCAYSQAKALYTRTAHIGSAISMASIKTTSSLSQIPSFIARGMPRVVKPTQLVAPPLSSRQTTTKKTKQSHVPSKVPYKAYEPTHLLEKRHLRGRKWLTMIRSVEENSTPLIKNAILTIGAAEKIKAQKGITGPKIDKIGTTDFTTTAFDAAYVSLTVYQECVGIGRIVNDIVMGRTPQSLKTAELWTTTHRIQMNKLRIAQIVLQRNIISLKARHPLKPTEKVALQRVQTLITELENKVIQFQKVFEKRGSLSKEKEFFLLDLKDANEKKLDVLFKKLNKENKKLRKRLPLQKKWINVHADQAKAEASKARVSYASTFIKTLKLSSALANFFEKNLAIGLSFVEPIKPIVGFFSNTAWLLSPPIGAARTVFSIYRWVEGEKIIRNINRYFLKKEAITANNKGTGLDAEMLAIANQVKQSQDRWPKLITNILNVVGTSTFFMNLGLTIAPILIPSISTLMTTTAAGLTIVWIAPWITFAAGAAMFAGSCGLLLYRMGRYAQTQYRIQKCSYVMSLFDALLKGHDAHGNNIPQKELNKIQTELEQLLGCKIGNLNIEQKKELYFKFHLRLIEYSPEYALQKFLERLMNEIAHSNDVSESEAYQFLQSLEIFTDAELEAIKHSGHIKATEWEVYELLKKRFRM